MNNIQNKDVRFSLPTPTTIAFKLFKEHFQEINDIYWSFFVTQSTVLKLKSDKIKENKNLTPYNFFIISDKYDRQLPKNMKTWETDFKKFASQSRLNFLLVTWSAFEVYMKSVFSSAFESMPGTILGYKYTVDGLGLMKNDRNYYDSKSAKYIFETNITSLLKGDWTQRFSNYLNYFGVLPVELLELRDELDNIRVLRNKIAHHVSRELENPLMLTTVSTIDYSHDRFIKHIGIIFSAAKLIDTQMRNDFIGIYELLKYYELNKHHFKTELMSSGGKANVLRDMTLGFKEDGKKAKYYKEVMKLYDLL